MNEPFVQLIAGGIADEWVTQLLRQGDSKVFKKYSQLKPEVVLVQREIEDRRHGEGKYFALAGGIFGPGSR